MRGACALLLGMLSLVAAPCRAADVTPEGNFDDALAVYRAGDPGAARRQLLELARGHDARAQDLLAAMYLKGVGGPSSTREAMGWYCMLAHQPAGGRAVVNALWFLAEYQRTGGGVPGQDYSGGDPARENPLKALFWFRLMFWQERFYQQVVPEGVSLGRLGSASVRRQLSDEERERVDRRAQQWSASRLPASGEACLALP